jgi:hypothetical protein
MKFCSTSSASDSVWTTSASIWSIIVRISGPAWVLGLEKCEAMRLRIDFALPT